MKNILMVLATIYIVLGVMAINLSATEYQHELKDDDISFAWSVDGDSLAVKIAAETEGWVGIGFNPTDKMAGADFVLGYVKKGKAAIVDEFGSDPTKHKADTKLGGTSDVVLVGGTEVDGVTTIEFTMPLNSGDKNDSKIDVGGETIVLLAYGAGRDSFLSKHKYRSTYKVNLTTGAFDKK